MEHSGAYVAEGPVKLWLPGLGVTDLRIRRVAVAVEQYDPALRLARHELNGDWVVVMGDQGHPIFGFGRELPRPEDVEHLLGKHDIKRHGKKLMADLAVMAERERLDSKYRQAEQNEELADHFAELYQTTGKRRGNRIFVPRSIPA